MYLSKIALAPQWRQARRMLGSPQVMHAMVMKACSDMPREDDGAGRVLWRVDRGEYGTVLYLVSPGAPALDQILSEACLPGAEVRTADYEPFLARLTTGQTWAFRLAANPVHSAPRGPQERGKRFGHVTTAQQAGWLESRAGKHGFEVLGAPQDDDGKLSTALVVRRQRPVFQRRRSEEGIADRVTISCVTFEGTLRVTDADALRHSLVSGIGPSKAYGCGLLTLAPARG